MKPSKAFYKDPLQAAWMTEHFGMEFPMQGANKRRGNYKTSTLAAHINWRRTKFQKTPEKYYIHPDSLQLLEGKVGDLYFVPKDSIAFILDEILCQKWDARPDGIIVQRNGIPFIWPEFENAN